MTRRGPLGLFTALLLVVTALVSSPPAYAAPATTVDYPTNASATRFRGAAFDTCDAPTTATMRAWRASPFRAIGIYIGGVNRTCSQAQLSAAWVRTVTTMGWRLIPIYLGYQAPCSTRRDRFTPASAAADGRRDAVDAVRQAAGLGLLPGSAIYGDVENYTATDDSCRLAVLRYVSAWTTELHRHGYLSGIYANLGSGARHLSAVYDSTTYARADVMWLARWDRDPALSGWSGIPDTQWSNRQRAKQYRGDHLETWGGVTLNIDSDSVNAPVATVAYRYQSARTLNVRSGPSTAYPVIRTHPAATTVPVVCQTAGERIGPTAVWDKLSTGGYVTDRYVSTPSSTGYSSPLPRCTYPFQVTASTLNERTGPGGTYAVARTLDAGSLAWVTCQRGGTRVGTTSVWNRLHNGNYVSDHYVATPNRTTYSASLPRC